MALNECYRVLKPEGIAIYSIPFFWHIHEEPRDFYRFTCYGLEHLFKKAGFEILEIKPLSGFIITFLQLHLYYLAGTINRGIIQKIGVFFVYVFFINRLGLLLKRFDRSYSFTYAYAVVVKKNKI